MTKGEHGPPGDRFVFIDGLRGVAAMMVVFYHLYAAFGKALASWFPTPLAWMLEHGNLGVDIFFVLSGFVIPYSVRNGDYSFSYLGRFALRRSIRLDPPLWLTIFVELALLRLGLLFFHDLGSTFPSPGQVVINMAYLQEILGVPNVVPAFWSLTYEVQFYLVVVLFLVISQWWSRREGRAPLLKRFQVGLAALAFVYSVAIYLGGVPTPFRGCFIERWYQFFLGSMVFMTVSGRLKNRWFVVAWISILAFTLIAVDSPFRFWSSLSALAVSALLFWAGHSGRMGTLLHSAPFQFLGRISYSLYLLHVPIGWRFVSLFVKLSGGELSITAGVLVFAGAMLASLVAAWLMYRWLEAPAMKLARRVRLAHRQPPVLTAATG